MEEEKLWTVILDNKTNKMVDAFDQSQPVCTGGPNTCGGCLQCIIAQCGDDWTIEYDLTTDEMLQLNNVKHKY